MPHVGWAPSDEWPLQQNASIHAACPLHVFGRTGPSCVSLAVIMLPAVMHIKGKGKRYSFPCT